MKRFTISEMSELYGLSDRVVTKAVKDGVLPAIKDITSGKYLVTEDDAKRFKDNYISYVAKDNSKAANTYSESRAALQAYKARMAKLEYEAMQGKLINVDEVKRDAFKIARILRDAILNVPIKLSHEIAAETNPKAIEKLLTTELRQVLSEISRGKYYEDAEPLPDFLL